MLKKALELCYNKHLNQVDKGGNPYFLHPIMVALLCDNENEKITALLHDIIEDTDYTFEDLRKDGFSEEIIEAIDFLTRRENESYDNYIKRCKENNISKSVKINDLIHNCDPTRLNEITKEDEMRIKKYEFYLKFLKD